MRKIFIVFIVFIIFISNCADKIPTKQTDSPDKILKSVKRGLAYNLVDSLDLDSLKNGVSWWYNWYFKTNAPEGYYEDYQMEFIPMLWGGNTAVDFIQVKNFILDHSEINYLFITILFCSKK